MYIKRSIKFSVEKRKKDGLLIEKNIPIKMRISYAGFPRLDIPIGARVDFYAWDSENETVVFNYTNKEGRKSTFINNLISAYRNYAEDAFNRYELVEKKIPAPDELKFIITDLAVRDGNRFKKKHSNTIESTCTLFSVFDEFMEKASVLRSWSDGTHTRYKVLKNKLYKFNPNLNLETIKDDDLIDFMKSMFNERLLNTTVSKKISDVKGFLRWASKNGHYNGNLHETFSPKLKGTDVVNEPVYLSWDELIYLYNLTVPDSKQYLERVRDVLCFCCFTSLRYSDVKKLTREDIKDSYFTLVTQKTTESIKIDFNKYSLAIIEKYKNTNFPDNRVLPVISNQDMNDYIKELGEFAGFTEPTKVVYFIDRKRYDEVFPKHALMSSHIGRRTFIVNSLYLGIPAEVVMKWTGHEDYNAMKPYIKIVDELKSVSMQKFNDRKINPNFTPKKNGIS
jgi:integrase